MANKKNVEANKKNTEIKNKKSNKLTKETNTKKEAQTAFTSKSEYPTFSVTHDDFAIIG